MTGLPRHICFIRKNIIHIFLERYLQSMKSPMIHFPLFFFFFLIIEVQRNLIGAMRL